LCLMYLSEPYQGCAPPHSIPIAIGIGELHSLTCQFLGATSYSDKSGADDKIRMQTRRSLSASRQAMLRRGLPDLNLGKVGQHQNKSIRLLYQMKKHHMCFFKMERMTRFEYRRGEACLHPDKLCFVGTCWTLTLAPIAIGALYPRPDSYRDRGATSAYMLC